MSLESMRKVRVLCAKNDSPAVVRALYDFGAIEVREQKLFPQSGKPLSEFSEISNALIELRPIEKFLETLPAFKEKKEKKAIENRGKAVQEFVAFPKLAGSMTLGELLEEYRRLPLAKFKELEKQLNALKERAFTLSQKRVELLPFKNLNVKTSLIYNASRDSRVRFAFFELKPKVLKEAFEKALRKEFSEPVYCSEKGRKYALVAFPERFAERMRTAATPFVANELAIPVVESEFFRDEIAKIEGELAENAEQRALVLRELNAFKKLFFTKIVSLREALELKAEEASLPARFGESERTLMLEGWIPTPLREKLRASLEKTLGKRFVLEDVKLGEHEPSPVLLKNPKTFKPFEFFVKFFSLPGVHDVDPTLLISLTFPLFFGMILGDVGYGLAALALALVIRSKFSKGFFRNASGIMMFSALFTIFFGFIYGEFFGFENILGYELHPLIHRVEEQGLQFLIALTVLVGFIHLAAGFAIGVFENARARHWKHAAAKAFWLLLEFSILSFFTASANIAFFELFKPMAAILTPSVSLPLTVIALVGIMVCEGAMAFFEVFTLFSNLFSYLRIMALGVSGVILALIINQLPLTVSLSNPVTIVSFTLFGLLFVFGHFTALLLGIFEASIQSLRLHYVEFFSKFYHGGGIPFLPLREKNI